MLHSEQERLRQLRPKGRSPLRTPHPPDWAALGSSGLPKAPTSSCPAEGSLLPSKPAVAADRNAADQVGQAQQLNNAGEPMQMESAFLQPEAQRSPATSEQLATDGLRRNGVRARDTAPPKDCQTSLGGNSAAEPQAAASEPVPAEPHAARQMYVARTQAQLHAAVGARGVQASAEGNSAPLGDPSPSKLAGASRSRTWRPAGQVAAADALCCVRVSVHVIGRGVAKEGAAVCALAPAEAASIRRRALRRKAPKRVPDGQSQLAAAARSGQPGSAQDVRSGRDEQDTTDRQVIGYVTSAAPRGLVSTGNIPAMIQGQSCMQITHSKLGTRGFFLLQSPKIVLLAMQTVCLQLTCGIV